MFRTSSVLNSAPTHNKRHRNAKPVPVKNLTVISFTVLSPR